MIVNRSAQNSYKYFKSIQYLHRPEINKHRGRWSLRLSTKMKYKNESLASGCKYKSEVLSLSSKCNSERASLPNLEEISAKPLIGKLGECCANFSYPFPTRIV